ncbi:MAG: hypothetical protein Q4A39_02105, partial [Eubacteriales bacterium]|nr:hypothetical protein [Eubacteriales bacterium]
MKWLIHGAGLLLSSAILTALSMSGIASSLGGAGFGILTVAVYFFGVYFVPRRVVRRLALKKASAPAPPLESSVEDAPAPVPAKKEPKRRPCRPDAVGYQFAVAILVCLLIAGIVSIGSKSSEIDRLRAELEDSYHEGYEIGYSEGESHGYNVGAEAILDDIDYYSCFSAGYDAGFATGQSDLSFPS